MIFLMVCCAGCLYLSPLFRALKPEVLFLIQGDITTDVKWSGTPLVQSPGHHTPSPLSTSTDCMINELGSQHPGFPGTALVHAYCFVVIMRGVFLFSLKSS